MKISVCMATYNGEAFIERQLSSILIQLNNYDEIIIVDDCSKDNTVQIIKKFSDSRIKLSLNQSNQGVIKTFEKAISRASGDVIFLSDQDDYWFNNKVLEIKEIIKKGADLIIHDASVVDREGSNIYQSWYEAIGGFKFGVLTNIIKNRFTGCCMAFNQSIKNKILPIPNQIDMHDQWIGIISALYKFNIYYSKKCLIKYTRHSSNLSTMGKRKIKIILVSRVKLIMYILIHIMKKKRQKI
jgi:glycosyltransferase involved in cell wall biosynthesis